MARIRSIKPDLSQDRKLAAVPRDARLLFVYGLTIADDEGFFRAELPHLKTLFPYDDDLTHEGLARLSRDLLQSGMWRERWTRDGCRVIEIVNWAKHQRIDHKSKSFIASELTPPGEEPSRDLRETVASPSRSRVLSLESLSLESLSPESLSPEIKTSRKRGASTVPATSWSAKAIDTWKACAGSHPVGPLVSALKPVYDELKDTDRLCYGLAKWLRAGNAKFGPAVFARDWRQWVPSGQDGLPKGNDLVMAEWLAKGADAHGP